MNFLEWNGSVIKISLSINCETISVVKLVLTKLAKYILTTFEIITFRRVKPSPSIENPAEGWMNSLGHVELPKTPNKLLLILGR